MRPTVENNMINNNDDKLSEQKSSKPPPIFVQNVKYIGNLTNALNSISNCKYKESGLYKKNKKLVFFANILLVAFEIIPFALNTTICTIKKIIQ